MYHFTDRRSQPVLDECVRRGIAFVPFWPLGSGGQGQGGVLQDSRVVRVADRLGATPAQVALAWLLDVAPNMLLIPGTSSRTHLRENLAVAGLYLDDDAARGCPSPGRSR